ncbi:PaaI family thioesterase [Iamia majanohamensis]|uniref:PaaI family thioesterase n=1 Tax=Iamia majanohamensis TaxID=467976 RepID=A0AAF0BVT0_9ACTN|nr:PaaI family thioesterase [Iamia majanohamensis]WCO67373.1 PaaI family thioesterase [Iamia majanohamensis]
MALTRLHNEDWGFASNCFVCEPRNDGGLRIPFHHDTDRDVVVASFTLDDTFSGAPSYVHGGVSLAVLDEAQAWATIAVAGRFAVTTETTTRFLRPVLVGEAYDVEARLTERGDERLATEGRITDVRGKVCAETTATFAVLGPAQAARATGVDEGALDPAYLRDDG